MLQLHRHASAVRCGYPRRPAPHGESRVRALAHPWLRSHVAAGAELIALVVAVSVLAAVTFAVLLLGVVELVSVAAR